MFTHQPNYNPATSMYDRSAHRCYDGIWAAAITLNCTINILAELGTSDHDLNNFARDDDQIVDKASRYIVKGRCVYLDN